MLACLIFDTACTCAACATVYLVSMPSCLPKEFGSLTIPPVYCYKLGQPASARCSILDVSHVHHQYDRYCGDCAVVFDLPLFHTVWISHVAV
jgi:hypothetical protein